MNFIFNFSKILLIVVLIIGCQTSPDIHQIIQPIKIVSGKADTLLISDMFYSESYDISFISNDNLVHKHLPNENKLVVESDPEFEGMTLLEFEIDMNLYHIPVISKKGTYYRFSLNPDKKYEKLYLFGSFNGWNRTNLPMTDKDGDGVFTAEVALDPGVHQYKFFADGLEILDPLNPQRIPNGLGGYNNIRTIDDPDSAEFYLHIDKYYSKNPQSTFSFYIEDKLDGEIKTENIFALLDNTKVSEEKITLDGNFISINFAFDELENQTLRVAASKNGRASNIQTIKLENGKPAGNSSFSWNDAIIYSIMIDRFKDSDNTNNDPIVHDSLSPKANYMGGDLQGIIEKLNEGYFESLGINTIWISPVYNNPNKAYKEFPAPHRYYSGYHGYWPISSYTVDEHFGNLEDVKRLVKIAHSKGIRILLDFVSNHTHIEHPYFKENRDWYGKLELPDGRLNIRFWDEYRLTTWFEPYLASFDFLGSKEAVEEITDVAVWWLNETGADGYRHDAVKHVPNEFWRRLNRKIMSQVAASKELQVYQIGETFGSYELISSYVNNGQLHAQFNFNLYDVALPTFIREGSSFNILDKEMHKTFSVYGTNHLMGNIMDSHDKNRFMAFADGDLDASQWSAIEEGWNNPPKVDNPESYKKLILYMAYMNSIPGIPVIYYGSEFGMTGASDPDNRRMMRFDDDLSDDEKRTMESVMKIINIRKDHSALRNGDFYTLHVDDDIYSYLRSNLKERILVVLNKSITAKTIDIIIPEFLEIEKAESLRNSNEIKLVDSQLLLDIKEMDWEMLLLN